MHGEGQQSPAFFEGIEKKVEIAIDPSAPPFRARGAEYWDGIVRACGARILSRISNEHVDAWLLSESSLFVWDHKLVMITCGRTVLTTSAREILRDVPEDKLRLFVYQRKNELFPHDQPTSFFDDASTLGELLPGRAFQFADKDEHHLYLFHLDRPAAADASDTTFEVLMHGLDPHARHLFGPSSGLAPGEVARASGLDSVFEGARFDEHLFEPCGYSCNAIRDEHYATVHVTPDEGGSYASFESNHADGGIDETVGRLLQIFKPRSFDLVLWQGEGSRRIASHGYRVRSHVAALLSCGYEVQFIHHYHPDSRQRRAVELNVAARRQLTE